MELKTVALYIVIIATSAGLAWLVFGSPQGDQDPAVDEDFVDVIDDPLWYRSIGKEERLEALAFRLPILSSSNIAPEQNGPMKDEVALLMDYHEDCVDAFVEHVMSRTRPTGPELSAYMEICARVKNPKLVPLIDRGLGHSAWEVVYNAADAATTQGDARAIPQLTSALMTQQTVEVFRVIDALVRTGGDEAFGALTYGLQREDPLVLKALLQPLAEAAYRPAVEDVRPLIRNNDIEVCVLAAYALGRMGQTEGRRRLQEIAADASLPGPARAQATSYLASIWAPGSDFMDFMKKRLDDEDPAVAFEARVALARQDDEEVMAGVMKDLEDSFGGTRRKAIGVLASTGLESHAEILASRLDDLNVEELGLLMRATARGGSTHCVALVAKVAERNDQMGYAAIQGLINVGDAALPFLKDLVAHHDERMMKLAALGAIGSITSEKARDTLESIDVSYSREYWLRQRTLLKILDLALARH